MTKVFKNLTLVLLLAILFLFARKVWAEDWQCLDGLVYSQESGECELYTLLTFSSNAHDTATQITVSSTPSDAVSFYSQDGKKVGALNWDKNGVFHFEGETDEAAKLFFDYVIKQCTNAYMDGYSKALKDHKCVMNVSDGKDFLY